MNYEKYILDLNIVLKQYFHKDELIVMVENTIGGIANKVLKLTTNHNKKFIFKIYQKKQNLSLPNALLEYLTIHNLNVVKSINNKPIEFEDTDCYLYNYIDFIPTIMNEDLENYILEILYHINNFIPNIKDYDKSHFLVFKCDEEYKLLKSKKQYKYNKKIICNVLKKYNQIRKKKIIYTKEITHSDISTSNLLNNYGKYFLIDFDETRITTKLYDLAVIIFKFYVNDKEINVEGIKMFINKYRKMFNYSLSQIFDVVTYYIVKQLLEKFTDYEIYNIDLYSPQQQQDDFRNWIYYFKNLNKFKEIIYG